MLWPDKPLSHVILPGDETALHVAGYHGTQLIGAGSFFLDPPQARLRKFAIAPACRGRGLGTALLQHGAGLLRQERIEVLLCDARQNACAFYEKLGFEIGGEVFFKDALPYVSAKLSLEQLLT
ncbi:GNAT family N-acetyltransferase [Roseovarius sp. EL26]|uniref:GNAT family N-acetyltransferase n=1 Tax=Roseovarius sp. EL26 TaxID=2126672 RepID=UPI0013C5248A|nr:GNAT family N-acetyltransferase [Roseovarius sp. EL26]